MKIDVHAHILPDKIPSFQNQFGYSGWIQLKHSDRFDSNGFRQSSMIFDDGRHFRSVDQRLYSVEKRLFAMKQTGVDMQVLSTVPVMFSYWSKAEHNEVVSRFLNDYLSGVIRRFPEKFIGLGTVPLQNVELAVKELIRCKSELNLKGIIIGTHVNDLSLDNPLFDPFWKAAEEYRMPLFIHPWDVSTANNRWSKYWLPYIVGMTAETTVAALSLAYSGVLERYRKLHIILSHGGGSLPYLNGRANQAFRVYPDDMASNVTWPPDYYLKRSPNVCADTLVHNVKALELTLDYFGQDSLFLGSDFPFLLGEAIPGSMIEESNCFTVDIKEKMLHKNILRFFSDF